MSTNNQSCQVQIQSCQRDPSTSNGLRPTVAPTKSRQGFEIRDKIISLLQKFKASGNPPRLHILDNEASHALKSTLLKSNIDYQLVPPHVHRRNAAERAIQTFKALFITTLCIADPNFPANEWDRLLLQAELTLNLLRNCRYNPKLSAYSAYTVLSISTAPR